MLFLDQCFSCVVPSTILSSCLSGKKELLLSHRFSWSLSVSDSFSLSGNVWACSCSTSSKTPLCCAVQYHCCCLCLLSFCFVLLRCASRSCALGVRDNTFFVAYPSTSRSTTFSQVSASSLTWSWTNDPKLAPWSVVKTLHDTSLCLRKNSEQKNFNWEGGVRSVQKKMNCVRFCHIHELHARQDHYIWMRKQSVAETPTKLYPSASTITCRKKSIIKFRFACLRSLVTNFLNVTTDFRIYLTCLEGWTANIPEDWPTAYTISLSYRSRNDLISVPDVKCTSQDTGQ